jgi:GNAT superfamily N-acetyltransferase
MGDFNPEFAGSVAGQKAQATILAHCDEIAAARGMVSRGTRVTVLDALERSPEELVDIARRFGSAIFVVSQREADRYCREVVAAGLSTGSFLVYASSDVAFARSRELVADQLPQHLELRQCRIDLNSSGDLIAKAQQLLEACGLPALPGYFLRGRTQPNLTLALLDPADAVVGMAIAMDDTSAGPAYTGWYFPASVAVAASWKGKGLGRWLNAAVIDLARREGGAVHVRESVSPTNTVSRRMIEGCGLALCENIVAVLASAEATPAAWHDGRS